MVTVALLLLHGRYFGTMRLRLLAQAGSSSGRDDGHIWLSIRRWLRIKPSEVILGWLAIWLCIRGPIIGHIVSPRTTAHQSFKHLTQGVAYQWNGT